ncbi:11303_t:CDS:2, partial [Dentiscutata erythropus]
IGCSDSRCPSKIITQSGLGELFIFQNIANQFKINDLNTTSLLEYTIKSLNIQHIIICSHYSCNRVGHIIDTANDTQNNNLNKWLSDVKDTYLSNQLLFTNKSIEEQKKILVDLNIKKQVFTISNMNISNKKIIIYGLVYDLKTGYLKTLNKCDCN